MALACCTASRLADDLEGFQRCPVGLSKRRLEFNVLGWHFAPSSPQVCGLLVASEEEPAAAAKEMQNHLQAQSLHVAEIAGDKGSVPLDGGDGDRGDGEE